MNQIAQYAQKLKQYAQAYWLKMLPRERLIIAIGLSLAMCLLFWVLLWQPWQRALAHMETVLPIKRAEVSWMRAYASADNGAKKSVKQFKSLNQSLTSVIEQTARASNIQKSVQQIVPQEKDKTVSVSLEGVSFNQWVRWVDSLQSDYGVRITQLSAEREDDKPDIAEIRVSFSR